MSGVPHCHPVGEEEFGSALGTTVGEGPEHERLRSQAACVAREGETILGFVHTAVGPTEDEDLIRGSIRFLWYERGRREAGQALLDAAEQDLRGKGMDRIEAIHCDDAYRFYHVRYGHLSDRLEHVQVLLKFNGYAASNGEVVLDWPAYDPVEPQAAGVEAEIALEWKDGRGRLPNLAIKALRDGERIGYCACVSCGEFSSAEAAQDVLFVDGLFINDEVQGRGLGRYLLQRAMRELYGAGYRNASISTDWQNHRALLFYSNYGFQMADWTFCYEKRL